MPNYPDTSGPNYLTYYTDALDANGVAYDIYDVDKRGNRSPDWLGVLSHYDAVIWYTGDDYLTRYPGQPGPDRNGALARRRDDRRPPLPQRGRQAVLHRQVGRPAVGRGLRVPQLRLPRAAARADGGAPPRLPEFNEDDPTQADGCIAHNNDFLQYYLGAYIYAAPGGSFDSATNRPYALRGTGPFAGLTWRFDETGANNQDHSATFAITSSVLDPARFPMFADSRSVADWLRPGAAPFGPYSGTMYMSAGADSQAYKRLGKTLDLTDATAPRLDFELSADVEPNWDFVIVEARDVTTDPNSDAWTTLPEVDTDGAGTADVSLTTQETGDSCDAGPAHRHRRAAPVPAALLVADVRAAGHDRRVARVHRLDQRLAALDLRPLGLCGQEGRHPDQRDHRLGHARPRHLGRRRAGLERLHDARVQRLRDRPRRLDDRPAAGRDRRRDRRLGPAYGAVQGGRRRRHRRHALHRVRLRGHQRVGAQRVHEAHADAPRRPARRTAGRHQHRHGHGRGDGPAHASSGGRRSPAHRSRPSTRARSSSSAAT